MLRRGERATKSQPGESQEAQARKWKKRVGAGVDLLRSLLGTDRHQEASSPGHPVELSAGAPRGDAGGGRRSVRGAGCHCAAAGAAGGASCGAADGGHLHGWVGPRRGPVRIGPQLDLCGYPFSARGQREVSYGKKGHLLLATLAAAAWPALTADGLAPVGCTPARPAYRTEGVLRADARWQLGFIKGPVVPGQRERLGHLQAPSPLPWCRCRRRRRRVVHHRRRIQSCLC